jgi:hypothetical protein
MSTPKFMQCSCPGDRFPLPSVADGGGMVQRVSTVAFEGIEARAVDVQVQVAPGLPAFAKVNRQCRKMRLWTITGHYFAALGHGCFKSFAKGAAAASV